MNIVDIVWKLLDYKWVWSLSMNIHNISQSEALAIKDKYEWKTESQWGYYVTDVGGHPRSVTLFTNHNMMTEKEQIEDENRVKEQEMKELDRLTEKYKGKKEKDG